MLFFQKESLFYLNIFNISFNSCKAKTEKKQHFVFMHFFHKKGTFFYKRRYK